MNLKTGDKVSMKNWPEIVGIVSRVSIKRQWADVRFPTRPGWDGRCTFEELGIQTGAEPERLPKGE